MKFICLAIASLGLASAAKIDRQQASQMLKSRQRRANSFMEEQTSRSNKERECIEEVCNTEELAEYLENLPRYKNMRRAQIKLEAQKQLGEMKKEREIAQHKKESKCPTFGYELSINDVNFQQIGDRETKKAYDYDEEGYCSVPLDICQIYLENNNERCVKANQFCQNLNVEKNNVTRGWDFYVENGQDYLGYNCLCDSGYEKDANDNCIKKAAPCSFSPCDNQPNTTCKNTKKFNNLVNSGFECVCKEGFERISSSVGCQSVCKAGFVWNTQFEICVEGLEGQDDYGNQEIENIFN